MPTDYIIFSCIQDDLPDGFSFHDALDKSELVLPEPEFAPRDPELEARCERLRREAEEREYRRMTADVDGKRTSIVEQDASVGKQVRGVNHF